MSGIALFCENLGAFPASRAKSLHARMRAEGCPGISSVLALVWPDYRPPAPPRPQDNRLAFSDWRASSGLPLCGWLNASPDQAGDVAALEHLDASLRPDGWLLDIEGEWTKTAKLATLAAGARKVAGERPLIASLAGFSPSGTSYDYRALELAGMDVDWQAYFDSGEGPTPATAVAELYRSPWIVAGWEYRHRLGSAYGWGRVTRTEADIVARFDSYRRPGPDDAALSVSKRFVNGSAFGHHVLDGVLRRDGKQVGLLMGRAAYPRIRVTLDVTRSAQQRPADAWTPIAASARVAGARKRPISVYLAENASDEVLLAIARGAA